MVGGVWMGGWVGWLVGWRGLCAMWIYFRFRFSGFRLAFGVGL